MVGDEYCFEFEFGCCVKDDFFDWVRVIVGVDSDLEFGFRCLFFFVLWGGCGFFLGLFLFV